MVEPQTFFQCLFSFVNHLPPRYLISKLFKGTHWKENGSLGNGCLPSLHIYILRDGSRYGQLTLYCKSVLLKILDEDLDITVYQCLKFHVFARRIGQQQSWRMGLNLLHQFFITIKEEKECTQNTAVLFQFLNPQYFFQISPHWYGVGHRDLVERFSLWYFSDISIHGFSGFGNGPS